MLENKYVGIDLHQSTCVIAVHNSDGKSVSEAIVDVLDAMFITNRIGNSGFRNFRLLKTRCAPIQPGTCPTVCPFGLNG
jgi:hypothetical protein